MKKLMIAAAIVCAAAISQAASYQWADANYDLMISGSGPDGIQVTAGTSVYLFDATTMTQQQVLDAFFGSGLSGYVSTSAVDADANITPKTFSDEKVAGVDPDWQGFYALLNDDGSEIFISEAKKFVVQQGSTEPVFFDDMFEQSIAPALETKTFEGAGWYAQSVPEPTSGLLLLLGMAGLALRRRRA